ncbi:MAG: hypothetical protein ACI84C_001454 [Flavobacteriales bacterium]|jgi:hypothetical protein
MQIDFIHNINNFGESVVRLFNFDKFQSNQLREAIEQTILTDQKPLDLMTLPFVQPVTCNLVLRISDEDIGIEDLEKVTFFCDLTLEAYRQMVTLIEPFCKKESSAHQWLYDVDTHIDLLFVPSGTSQADDDEEEDGK